MIKSIRDKILDIESKIRDTHDSYVNRDVSDLLDLTATHSITRAEHINAIKEIIELLRNNLHRMGNLEDLKQIEENLGLYKRNIEDDQHEVDVKDKKVTDATNESHSLRLEVDRTRNARSDNEAENMNLNVTRVM